MRGNSGKAQGLRLGRRDAIKGMAAAGAASMAGGAMGAASPSDLTWLSATQLRELMVTKQVSAREVTQHFLDRIERLEPLLHAFVNVDRKGALEAAAQADADLKGGKTPGPLHGVPIAIKDQLWAKGMPATCGSLIFARFRPSFDGSVVQRLRAAGAIIVGKTNLSEFAAWPRSHSHVAGESLNPWDTTRIAGASSGGSSAAVAAAMVPVAIGTDGGGSVRIPASLCGLVGLFPTLGRVANYGAFHCGTTGGAGPMARSVADAALVQQVIAGPDPRIRTVSSLTEVDVLSGLGTGVSGMRIAWSRDFGHIAVDPLVADMAASGLSVLEGAGALVEVVSDHVPHPWGDDGKMMEPIQRAVGAGGYATVPAGEIPDTQAAESWIAAISATPGSTIFATPEFRELYSRHSGLLTPPQRLLADVRPILGGEPSDEELHGAIDSIFEEHDVLCTPTMAVVAPPAPQGWAQPYPDHFMGTNFTFIANATGRPAVTVPCGFVRDLPVGLQIIGRPGDEPSVLRVARAIEIGLGALPRPPLAVLR
ncbi:MAG: amidase [Novosphingobium sp.]|nr:amidase [Novosphingobium sp.]